MDKQQLTAQDLSLFIGQEVQTPDGDAILYFIGNKSCQVLINFGIEIKNYSIEKIKPICRKRKNMTEEEKTEYEHDVIFWHAYYQFKWLAKRGYCPNNNWSEQGLVIEKNG